MTPLCVPVPLECESDLPIYPTCSDVVTGREKLAFSHPGNHLYRSLIHKHREPYQSTQRRTLKAVVIRDVMKAIQNQGGRFLAIEGDECDPLTIVYREMTESEILKKISHALRSAKGTSQPSSCRTIRQTLIEDYDDNSSQVSNESALLSASERSQTLPKSSSFDDTFSRLLCEQRKIFSILVKDDGDTTFHEPFDLLLESDSNFPSCDDSKTAAPSFYTLDGAPAKVKF